MWSIISKEFLFKKVDPLDVLSVAFPYPELEDEFQEEMEDEDDEPQVLLLFKKEFLNLKKTDFVVQLRTCQSKRANGATRIADSEPVLCPIAIEIQTMDP